MTAAVIAGNKRLHCTRWNVTVSRQNTWHPWFSKR